MAERSPIYPVFLENAGCLERCVFCAQDRSSPGFGLEVQQVKDQLERLVPQKGEGEIAFYGGTFTQLPESFQDQLLSLASEMVKAGRVSGIRISTRPDALNRAEIERLRAAPVTTVELGCQSFDSGVLRLCRRHYDPESVAGAVRALRQSGVRVGLQLMPGLPGSSNDEAMTSLSQALSLRPDFLRIYPTVVLKGTPLETLWENGEYKPWSLPRTIRVGARMLKCSHLAGVPVIRFGLQGDRSLESNLVAGPYHPALGQLVRSRLWLDELIQQDLESGDVIYVHRADLSDVLGHKRRNMRALHRSFGVRIEPSTSVVRGCYVRRDVSHKVAGLTPAGESGYGRKQR